MRKMSRSMVVVGCLFAAMVTGADESAGGDLDLPGAVASGTALGDAGHFMRFVPALHVLNPEGRPFEIRFQRFLFPDLKMYSAPLRVTVYAPDGATLREETLPMTSENAPASVAVPGAGVGAYRIAVDGGGSYWHCQVDLPFAVLDVSEPGADAPDHSRPVLNPMAPRRWWFWVPDDATRFTVRAKRLGFMSQREDYGLTVFSPRGQRMAVLWGQPNPGDPPIEERTVLVEPGSAGRFWSLEVRLGDSHTFSDVNVTLDGIPPYLASAPERWFDPTTGRPAPVPVYDEAQFVQSARNEAARNRNLAHWSPCPSLGDPDGCEILAPARFALWNPEDRELLFRIGTYLTRPTPDHARVRMESAAGRIILDETIELLTLHDGRTGWPDRRLKTGVEPVFASVDEAEHFIAYTYPATPTVLIGREMEDGWRRFGIEVGTARDWYFFVPAGTTQFSLRVDTGEGTDIVALDVNAPDRTVARLYARRQTLEVAVPAELTGTMWHLRMDVGSSTRFETSGMRPRHATIALNLDLRGVPGYLAPTWEQWFDPANPRSAIRRNARD